MIIGNFFFWVDARRGIIKDIQKVCFKYRIISLIVYLLQCNFCEEE